MTFRLIIHLLVATVITWIGMIMIIIADMFSWPHLIGCFIAGNLIAIPATYIISRKSKDL